MGRHTCCLKQKLRKGLWSPEEDEKLLQHITKYGHGCWSSVPKLAGLQRCGKSCRLRWINYLRPDLKRGAFSQEEEDLIIQFHSELGNRWSQIAARLPGRTDNEIKNLWNSSIKKKLREKGIDPNTHKPLSHDKAAGTPNSIPSGQQAADREPEGAPTFRSSLRFPTDYDANPVFPFRHEPDSRPILPALPPSTSIISTSTTGLGTMATLLQVNTRACCASALSGSGYWESGTSSSGSGTTANSNSSSSSSSIELQATTPFLQSSAFPWRELAGNREPDQLHVEDELDELNWTEFLQSATMTSIPTPPTFHQSLDQSQTQIQNLKLNVKASTAQFALDELTNWQQLSRSSLLSPLAPLQQHQQQQNQIAQLKNSDTYSKDLQRISTAFGQV